MIRTLGLVENENRLKVYPVIYHASRELCTRPYPGHRHGCPNFGKKEGCPPLAPLFDEYFDLTQPVYAVVNEFDLNKHVEKLRKKFPDWSWRQLVNCLYWQNTARKQLRLKIKDVLSQLSHKYVVSTCPEAMGVNVTATLKHVGIELEWPPIIVVRQVALIAKKRGGK